MPTATARHVPVTNLSNGHELTIPVHTIGNGSGPRLGLVSGVHGDEPLAVETVRRVVKQLESQEVNGTVLAIPVANAYSHMALTRQTPLDGMNLNRIFPGASDGSVTEQVAAALLEILVDNVDYLIDFHSGGILACVDYTYLGTDTEFAKAYGADLLFRGPGYPGSLTSTLQTHGVTTIVSEFGGGSARIQHYLDKGVNGTLNVMRHLKMIAGDAQLVTGQRIIGDLVKVAPRQGGILLSELSPDRLGETVPGGTVLGRVINPHTFDELETVTAPFKESILVLTRPSYTNVQPGDYGYMVADGAGVVTA